MVEGLVNQYAELVAPCRIESKFVKVIHHQGGGTRERVLPRRSQPVGTGGIGGAHEENMTLLASEHGLSGGMEQVRTSGLGLGDDEEGIEMVRRTVDDLLTILCGLEVLLGNKPLLERQLAGPRQTPRPVRGDVEHTRGVERLIRLRGGQLLTKFVSYFPTLFAQDLTPNRSPIVLNADEKVRCIRRGGGRLGRLKSLLQSNQALSHVSGIARFTVKK